jgi:hypothetical protein
VVVYSLFGCRLQNSEDTTAITKTILDYYEGWYSGDANRFAGSIDSNYLNRRINIIPIDNISISSNSLNSTETKYLNIQNNEPSIERSTIDVDKNEMVKYAKLGGGKNRPKNDIKMKIEILDVSDNIASVKMVSEYIDYMHLIKKDGKWLILTGLYDDNRQIKK